VTEAARSGRVASFCLLLAFAALGFVWMPAEFLAGDPVAWREEARSLVLTGRLSIPEEVALGFGEPGQYFARNERTGLYYSKYGIVNTLLAVPPLWLEGVFGGDVGARLRYPSLLLFNLWYLALGTALAALLYAATAAYSARPAVRVLFVCAAFYCTCLWFYQRGQSSESYQVLFFTALFMALTGFLRPLSRQGASRLGRSAWTCLAAAWVCVAVLVFTRLIYGLLLPIVVLLAAWYAARGRPLRELRADAATLGAALLLPPLLIVVLLGIVNHLKFGAPWLTGYHQWSAALHWPIGRPVDGLWGYLFSPRFSVFLTFPPLLLALAGWRQFAERYRVDAVVILSLFLPFLLYFASTPIWTGDWTYGPRYLLAMLPILSLPFLTFAEDIIARIGTWPARAWALAAAGILAYSCYLQIGMNRAPFFTYYHAREALVDVRSAESIDYFFNHHDAVIVAQLMAHRRDLDALPFYAELKRTGRPEFVKAYTENLVFLLERGNLYWSLPPAQRR
jgi:hypothetical protein